MRALPKQIRSFTRDEAGASAVEFALVMIPTILLTLGTINLCLIIYTVATLHFAVEDAARCASVKTTICNSTGATQTYAASKYVGPTVTPVFAATTQGCGNQVVGTANFNFSSGVAQWTIPLSASACYPLA